MFFGGSAGASITKVPVHVGSITYSVTSPLPIRTV